jgi:hypothetical protein
MGEEAVVVMRAGALASIELSPGTLWGAHRAGGWLVAPAVDGRPPGASPPRTGLCDRG